MVKKPKTRIITDDELAAVGYTPEEIKAQTHTGEKKKRKRKRKSITKAALMAKARKLKIPGRSRMNKEALAMAIENWQ